MLLFAKHTDILSLGISTDGMVGAFCGISGPLTMVFVYITGGHTGVVDNTLCPYLVVQ